jgi:MFS family permease
LKLALLSVGEHQTWILLSLGEQYADSERLVCISGLLIVGLYIGVMAIISGNTSDQERPTYIGLAGAMWGFASVLGPVLGGAFTASAGGWRWVSISLSTALTIVILY